MHEESPFCSLATEVSAPLANSSLGMSILRWQQTRGFPGGTDSKESAHQCKRCGFNPFVGKMPWSRKGKSTPVLPHGKFQGHRSLEVHGISKNGAGLSSHTCQQTGQRGNADVLNSGVLPPSSLCLIFSWYEIFYFQVIP